MLRSAKISYLLLYFLFFLFGHSPISNSEIIIRDVETENFIAKLTKPIFRAANLEQESVSIIILKNKEINAFVTGGQNIFLTTETLLQAKDYTFCKFNRSRGWDYHRWRCKGSTRSCGRYPRSYKKKYYGIHKIS